MLNEIIRLVLSVMLLMMGMRIAFGELDSRMAKKRYDLNYFLNFEKPFSYRNGRSTIVMMVFCFILFGGVNIFSKEGLLLIVTFVAIGVIVDVLSSWLFHYYARLRFKKQILETKEEVEKLKKEMTMPTDESEVMETGDDYDFLEVVDRYVDEKAHLACFSRDGGRFMSAFKHYAQVNFLVDDKLEEAKKRLEDTAVRVTGLTKDKKYPFKDEKMDVVVCYNDNFLPQEVSRILKDNGIFVVHQYGSENLMELNALNHPIQVKNMWNMHALSDGLRQNRYLLLDRRECHGEVRFFSLSAFVNYITTNSKAKIEQMENYINSLNIISKIIQKNGYFAMKTHHFYVVARKKGQES